MSQGLCIPRNGQDMFTLSLAWNYSHHDYDHSRHYGLYGDSSHLTSACHSLSSLHHLCILLFYDHIILFMILMTHTFSQHSLTQPGPSLGSHSFDYSSLSRLCLHLTQPTPCLFYSCLWSYSHHGHSSISSSSGCLI